MAKDWRNKKDYDYMDNHTPDLWAWEFLRRNPDYINDWERALSPYLDDLQAEALRLTAFFRGNEKYSLIPGFNKEVYLRDLTEEERKPFIERLHWYYDVNKVVDMVAFDEARSRWGLMVNMIFNPNIDMPTRVFYPTFFYQYGPVYSKKDALPDLLSSEVVVVFDLSKPIQQQLEHFKVLLEEEQMHLRIYSDLDIANVKNKPQYWKDHLRIFDARESGATDKEIADVMFKGDSSYDSVVKKIDNSHDRVKKMAEGDYWKILQQPSKMKKR